jgi:ubiquinone/menaquinone biosynthesis C-methylase UbiE
MNNLSENSKTYYDENHIYQLFSNAEDFPDYIFSFLIPFFQNKTILDLGCGNGKYTNKIHNINKNIIGFDKSFPQLNHKNRNQNINFINGDAFQLPFKNNSFDLIFSSWMLGTIADENKQQAIIKEAKRTLKENGKIILIENDINSEFEILRGRFSENDERTLAYNNFLINNGFQIIKKINTYFEFENDIIANNVFKSIWKERLIKKIISAKIEHKVIIFSCEKQ